MPSTRSVDGTTIGWDDSGAGPALLLVHGGVGDASAWDQVRTLLPEGVRVMAMDRRGRGRSDRADGVAHDLEVEAADVIAVAEAADGDVVVVGHSIGATIALQSLRRRGDLFSAAVLYEPPLPGMPSGLGTSAVMLDALDAGRHADALEAFLRDMVRLDASAVAAVRASPLWARWVGLVWTMRRESDALGAVSADIGRYRSIDVPVTLLVGDRTAAHHREAVNALTAALPHATTQTMTGQGHGALTTAPQLVAEAILAHIAPLP